MTASGLQIGHEMGVVAGTPATLLAPLHPNADHLPDQERGSHSVSISTGEAIVSVSAPGKP
jgi:hypothetical protein